VGGVGNDLKRRYWLDAVIEAGLHGTTLDDAPADLNHNPFPSYGSSFLNAGLTLVGPFQIVQQRSSLGPQTRQT